MRRGWRWPRRQLRQWRDLGDLVQHDSQRNRKARGDSAAVLTASTSCQTNMVAKGAQFTAELLSDTTTRVSVLVTTWPGRTPGHRAWGVSRSSTCCTENGPSVACRACEATVSSAPVARLRSWPAHLGSAFGWGGGCGDLHRGCRRFSRSIPRPITSANGRPSRPAACSSLASASPQVPRKKPGVTRVPGHPVPVGCSPAGWCRLFRRGHSEWAPSPVDASRNPLEDPMVDTDLAATRSRPRRLQPGSCPVHWARRPLPSSSIRRAQEAAPGPLQGTGGPTSGIRSRQHGRQQRTDRGHLRDPVVHRSGRRLPHCPRSEFEWTTHPAHGTRRHQARGGRRARAS
jgi:hypothetical protein